MSGTPDKPPYGAACNHCGQCCEARLCPLGAIVFQRSDGPCPALGYVGEGIGYDGEARSTCGLIVNPRAYAPVLAALNGVDALSEGAKLLCGAGIGCDALADGEREPAATRDAIFAKAGATPRVYVRRAKISWGLL